MNHFIIKASLTKDFFLSPSEQFIFFYCQGLDDLTKTLRCITPRGYRVRKNSWFSKYLKECHNDLQLRSGLTGQVMYQIRKVDYIVSCDKIFDYTNNFGFTHRLKTASEKYWMKFNKV